ncbi:MAG TPA: DUF2231 domain-containing protein [Candidatus Binataceae bacterium]|nr:DUF2231 domain-containing protein [Candidatus Binataceae bacterium]
MTLATLLPGAAHLQNIHPLVVHYPLALLSVAVMLYLATWIAGRPRWAWLAFWMLILGTVGAWVAAATGLYAEDGVMVARSVRNHLLLHHEHLMLVTVGLATVGTLWAGLAPPFPGRTRPFFVLLLIALVAVMTVGADYGGRLVYDYNAGGDACSQPIDFTR